MKFPFTLIILFCCITFAQAQLPPKWKYLGGDTVVQFATMDMDIYGRIWGYPVYRNEKLTKKLGGSFRTMLYGNVSENMVVYPDTIDIFHNYLQVLPDGNMIFCGGGYVQPPSINILNIFTTKWINKVELPGYRAITSITMDKLGVLYCSTEDWLILNSTDFGNSWNAIYNPWKYITNLYIDSQNNLIAKYGDGFNNQGLFRTTDYGQTWVRLDSLFFNENIRISVQLRFQTIVAPNKLYISASYYEDSKSRKMFFSSKLDGTEIDTISYDSTWEFSIPEDIVFDSSGVLFGNYDRCLAYSLDTGRYSFQRTAVITNDPPNPPYLSGIWDSVGIQGKMGYDKFTFLINGDLHWGHHHFKCTFPDIYVPPRRMGSMNRCGYATSTFVADTLASVEFIQAASMNVAVRYDTIVPRRSIRVHVNVIDTSKYAHFLFRATTHKGHKTEWGDNIFPKVQQTELQLRKGKTNKVPDSLDAGFAVNYLWYRNGEKIGYNGSTVFLRTERVLELTKPGTYVCEIFDTTGCVQTTAPYTYNPVSVPEETDAQIQVFPNPANQSITITGIGDIIHDIQITDVLGNVVLVSDAKHRISAGMLIIDVTTLPNG
ncbi:MAG: hypothetical protein JNJ85_16705, partial [Candidatus Kapabacteria bacterium]|nr:hypothetical protein [Candidatus Kapabacteria bacterium]